MPVETSIQLYLNGKEPTSEEEWLQIGGENRFMKTKIIQTLQFGMPSDILRNKRMAVEMGRLMREKNTMSFFFAVGVSHVTFSSLKNPNILDHLKASGFHIERVQPGEIITGGSVYLEELRCRILWFQSKDLFAQYSAYKRTTN